MTEIQFQRLMLVVAIIGSIAMVSVSFGGVTL